MAIAWEGACQSNGQPGTYYSYAAEYSNRRSNKVHVRLKLWLRLAYKSSYFSFAIAHECKVNNVYQKTNLKMDRTFWGGWSTYGWAPYDSNMEDMLDGTTWHGPYIVFDGDVPVGIESETVSIIPCITRPCICVGGPEPYQLNELEKCNWQGRRGVWHPWGSDEYVGYWADWGCAEDGCFLNNRWLEELSGGLRIPAYPRVKQATSVTLSPTSIDVMQTSATAVAKWALPTGASGTTLTVTRTRSGSATATSKAVNIPGRVTTYSFTPHRMFNEQAGKVGDSYRVNVLPYDSNNVPAANTASSNSLTYVAHIKPQPVAAVNIDTVRINVANQDTKTVHASWTRPSAASNSPVATPVGGFNIFVGKYIDEQIDYKFVAYTKSTSIDLNVKSGYGLDEVFDGDRFVIGVQSADDYGTVSDSIVASTSIEYFEIASIAPTEAYIMGRYGTPNYVLFKGEDCIVNYRGESDGSYPIARYSLYRLSDGVSIDWLPSDALSSTYRQVVRHIAEVASPNTYEVWELRAYNTKNRPVYSNTQAQTWTQITVYYYGGLIYVYDGGNKMWRSGICYVWDGAGSWHEAEMVSIYDGGEWRTL